MEGGGDCINIKIYFHYFPQLLLSFRRKGKKSLCAVKHANSGAGKNRQAQYYLDFIFRSLMLSYHLSLFSPFLPFIPYFNGRGVLAGCDCLIDRYLLLEKVHGRGDGLRMRCAFCRPQGQGALCVCRMMDYM